jgi:ATP-binding cassette subfamily B protein RaxB
MQSVKLFNRESQRGTLYQNLAVDTFNAGIRLQKLRIVFSSLNGILFGAADMGVIWLGATFVLDGRFSVGMLFAFLSYQSQYKSRITSLIDNAIDIAQTEPEAVSPGAGIAPPALRADLEVRDLGVRYAESEPFVLRHVSLRVEEGESVAIVGPSGCGKTTLLRAMLGLLPAQEGEILIGGVTLGRLGTSHYRSLIGTVMQDDRLFDGSIAENIAFFDPTPDMALVESSATLAAIHEDILNMPMGYNTLIGDMGTVLSGGQQQRVLLARALYKRPRILLLDEATSHLDVAREKQVSEAVRRLELTRVIVAHRPETIASADRVISLTEIVPDPPSLDRLGRLHDAIVSESSRRRFRVS